MNEFKFELDKSLIEPFLTDFKNDAKTKNARNIQGTGWINPIIDQIKIIENNDDIDLQVDKNRLYENARKNVNYWTIHCHCKKCKVKYSIYVINKPTENENLITFNVQSNEHDLQQHNEKKIRVTKENRVALAESMILNAGGSAKHYHDQQVGLGLTKIPSQDVMKQMMSEYMHVDMTSTNWLTNLLYQHDTTKALQSDSKWINYNLKLIKQYLHQGVFYTWMQLVT